MSPEAAPQAGWVYVLTNAAMPGLVKIGHTARSPARRAAELTGATGVPAPFVVAWAHPVVDHEALEGIVHDHLAFCRTRQNREFFRCSPDQARRIIEREAAALLLPWWRAWLHPRRYPRSPSRSISRKAAARGSGRAVLRMLVAPATVAGIYVLATKPAWLPPALLDLIGQLPVLGRSAGPQF